MIDHKVHAILRPTREYPSFSFNEYSRVVQPAQVDNLEEAVAEQNLLDLYPIVTTAERVIVDGQHRFSMAKNLMIPFYYTASNHLDVGDIMASNELTLSYSERDAMQVYTSMEIEPYVVMADFMDRFKEATDSLIGNAAGLLSKRHSKASFLRGDLVIDQMTWAEKVARYTTEIMQYSKRKIFNTAYRTALIQIMLTGHYDHSRMIDRVEERPMKLVRCGETRHAVAVLQEIYNFNKAPQNRIDFLSLVDSRKSAPADDHIFSNCSPLPQRHIDGRKESVIYTTNDYSIFSVHPSLRPLREVDKLRDYMQQKNLLQHYPIIVNKEFQILDGQRRFQSAKQLDLPIYFVVSENFSVWMTIIAGGTRKNWSLTDYLDSYVKQGLPEYVWAKQMRNRYVAMSPSTLMHVHVGGYADKVRKFRLGQAKFNHKYIEDFCRRWDDGIESSQRWRNLTLIRAAFGICDYGESMDRLPRLIQVVNRNWETFKIVMPLPYTAELLLDLFNKWLKTTEPVRSRSTTPGVGVYRPRTAQLI